MKILYGKNGIYKDITKHCLILLSKNNIIKIPKGDVIRAKIFGDTCRRVVKEIIVEQNINNQYNKNIYSHTQEVIINQEPININYEDLSPELKVKYLHKKLNFKFGKIHEEYTEQLLAVKHIKPDDKVLEIGGNIGRNSLIISTILNDSKNLVVLESDPKIAKQLDTNRRINNFNFKVIPSALSKNKLIQMKWKTLVSDTLLPGYKWVPIINLEQLKQKTNIQFNTLVLDCEGAFYFILKDFPTILNGINKLLIENDFVSKKHKEYVFDILRKSNFKVVESVDLNFKKRHIKDFHQVWIRTVDSL